ncbi:MAG: type II toxin-antitoxin system HicA family toxin [Thaumarchaeota archaeon]|nr:type II toxin-antitoxin system HicA family toxin [Nitrososphaerota archaeon]
MVQSFGFQAIRQKGSHVTLTNGRIHITVSPKRIGVCLLNAILKDAEIKREFKSDC